MGHGSKQKKALMRGNAAGTSNAEIERFGSVIVCLVLAALVFIVFGQTLWHDFVNYDDYQYVYGNPMVTNGLTFAGIEWAFTHVHGGNWHPLTTISHMLDCQVADL